MSRPFFALNYMTRFRCIAERCEDTCCAGMQIPLTAADENRLKRTVDEAEFAELVTPIEQPVHGCASVLTRTPEGACRSLDSSGLCSLVVRAGDDVLSDACALFPRAVAQTPERVELSGSLACPEAARLCLLADDGLEFVSSSPKLISRLTPTEFPAEREPYDSLAELVRESAVKIFCERAWPVRTRLMQLAELGARTEDFFFRGGPSEVRERLLREIERTSWSETHDALERTEPNGTLVIQMLFSLMTGLRGRGTARFGQLLDVVTYTYQTAALELEPSLGATPQPTLLWNALWTALRMKSERADRVFSGRLDVLLERYWINDLYRAPYTRSPSLSAHAFQMILRGAVLRFLVLGHPAVEQLSANATADLRTFDAAFIETVQLYAKHIEKDADMFTMLAAHFSLESLKTDALGRARIFAIAT